MTEERDPRLQSLFAAADQELPDDPFTAEVMAGVKRMRRWAMAGRILAGLTLTAAAVLLAPLVQGAVIAAMPILHMPVVDVSNPWVAEILSPVNSIRGALALAVLGAHFTYRRIFF